MPAPIEAPHPGAARLSRNLGLTLLVCYGLGVTVGAGIYVLVGEAGTRAGINAPVAFLISATIMGFTAASFAELAVRHPVSAGEAAYVEAGLSSRWLGVAAGMLVVVAGMVSTAAIARGATGYLQVILPLPDTVWVATVVLAMGAVSAWGIREAVGFAAIMTVIEVGGLIVVIGAGLWHQPSLATELPSAFSGLGSFGPWPGVLGASMVAFFAFIGFEGVVNVVEEVRRPERTVPLAIALTLVISTILYVLVVWVVQQSIPAQELSTSSAPLSLAFERLTGASPLILALIGVFATINGVIAQTVMSSRVLYGLARRGALPAILARVDTHTHTPLFATVTVVAVVLLLALTIPIESLADMTSRVMLFVFALVNASLVAIKLRGDAAPPRTNVPVLVPVIGTLSCLALLLVDLWLQ
ncbi:MAG: APC family permease [Hyphomicrobiaceae bacterium]